MKQPQRNTLRRGRRGLAKAAGLFSSLALWALAASATPACNSLGDGGDKTIPNSGKGDPMTTKQNTASTTGDADDQEKKGECRTKLSTSAYMVTQLGGTEPPHSGKYVHHKGQGTYVCVCCGQPLFESTTKFDSGSGWPSFYEAAEKGSVTLHRDPSHGMARTEVRCGRCNAHLGHVFDDGPKPTGKRYCINSVALDFEHTVAPESR